MGLDIYIYSGNKIPKDEEEYWKNEKLYTEVATFPRNCWPLNTWLNKLHNKKYNYINSIEYNGIITPLEKKDFEELLILTKRKKFIPSNYLEEWYPDEDTDPEPKWVDDIEIEIEGKNYLFYNFILPIKKILKMIKDNPELKFFSVTSW